MNKSHHSEKYTHYFLEVNLLYRTDRSALHDQFQRKQEPGRFR